jgi:alkanesulfonate monooxygenase SsuD/methylene tetrahydromethanopterin reductase-like flavin-dependent oxidoreductase (luciferase family)
MYGDQKLKLGLFGFSASGGMVMMRDSPLRIEWDEMISITKKAEALDFEAVIPVARWRGYGGDTNYNGIGYEPFTWAAGLSAITERISVFATVHVPLIHPIAAAKMATTVDHIAGGRFGMNVVMGWNEKEMEMFGVEQYEHDRRYEFGAEWLDVVNRLWSEENNFDFDGQFFHLKDLEARPTPIQGRPMILNAGTSPAAKAFASRYVDFIFGVPPTLEAASQLVVDAKAGAAEFDRELGVVSCAMVICRDTEAEAEAVYDEILEKGDWTGAESAMEMLGLHSESFGEALRDFQTRFVIGFGAQVVVGTPDTVVEELRSLSDAGISGVMLGFLDYDGELDYFAEKVMPLLKEAGLRH